MQQEFDDLLNFIDEFEFRYQEEQDSLPFHFNIVDELHVNENAHTRILMKLLQYEKGKKFPILLSFIKFLSAYFNDDFQICKPRLYIGLEFIDGLIEDPGHYAIIIENKVCGAVDQDSQLERYIETIEKHGFNSSDIYVIYLTLDGNKTASNYSFTLKAKKKLGFIDNQSTGRFIQINYNQHILPWLKEVIAPTYREEDFLYSGIFQYIDYIEGLLEIRKDDLPMKEQLIDIIVEKYNLKNMDTRESFIEVSNKLHSIELLNDSLIDLQGSLIKDICDQSLLPRLSKIIKKYECNLEDFSCDNTYINIEIIHPNWKKCKFKFYTENQNNVFGICYIDSSKPISEKSQKLLMIDTYKSSKWWPIWKYAPSTFRYVNIDFWLSVSRGDLSQYIIDEFERIMKTIVNHELKL
jgi:hypothetical protein